MVDFLETLPHPSSSSWDFDLWDLRTTTPCSSSSSSSSPQPSYFYAVNSIPVSSVASDSRNYSQPMLLLANPRNGFDGDHSVMVSTSHPQPPCVSAKKINNYVVLHKDTIKLVMDAKDFGNYLVSFTFDAIVDGRTLMFLLEVLTKLFSLVVSCWFFEGTSYIYIYIYNAILFILRFFVDDSITIFFFAKEEGNCTFTPLYPECCVPRKIPFQKGLSQKFFQPSGTGIDLGFFDIDELSSFQEGIVPLVIHVETCLLSLSADAQSIQPLQTMSAAAQVTQAILEKNNEGQFRVRVVEQIVWVDGVSYELLELYGIGPLGEAGADDNEPGKECVICMAKPKDTTILPCRHMVRVPTFSLSINFLQDQEKLILAMTILSILEPGCLTWLGILLIFCKCAAFSKVPHCEMLFKLATGNVTDVPEIHCMCSDCAETLRTRSDRCPICRQFIEQLVVMKADKGED
ncbi:hypothetical protein FEM48_Zijuj02G0147300 [Ziziphus jujuba var. spinosa]|uniref:RING-type E3 ubiquitin transferase n=1 Tax=Ziziphus jujuba var. spinosa TaxID=714518 RepID=A0A978VWA5_ZIZJJ|nr:hypothetical protein FEM48_Zijuj02G0147300 [Ziziphus jujuba var. spinosa]